MAFGKFVAYEPAEIEGSWNFKTADGKDLLFSGAEAEQLKSRIDASDAANTYAQNMSVPEDDAGGGMMRLDAGPNMSEAPAPPAAAPPSAAPAKSGNPFNKSATDLKGAGGKIAEQNRAELGVEPPKPGQAQERAAPTGGAQDGLRPVVANGVNTGYVQDASGQIYERRAGSAGVSQGQLQNAAGKGVATPTSLQETQAGGFAPDQEFLEGRRERTVDQRLRLQDQRDLALQDIELERQFARDQLVASSNAQQEQQAQMNAIQQRVAQDEAMYRKARDEARSARADPDRYFHKTDDSVPGLLRVTSMLAAGMGTFGAAMTGGRNFALDMINSAIDRDIRAQEVDIKTKGEAADNALSDLTRSGMSLDQAKLSLKAVQTDYARSKFLEARQASSSDRVNQQFDQLDLKLQENLANADEAYRQDSIGRATKTVAAQYQYPRAGTAGGFAPVTGERGLRLAGGLADVEGKTAGTAKTIGEIGNTGPGGAKRSMFLDQVDAAAASLTDAAKNLSKYDDDEVSKMAENRGAIPRAANAAQDFFMGQGSSARGLSERDKAMIQDTEAADGQVRSLTSVLSGQGALSGPETEVANKGLSPGATVGEKKRAVALVLSRAKAIKEGQFNNFSPAVAPPQAPE